MWEFTDIVPPAINWGDTPDRQAQAVIDAVRSVTYSKSVPRPAWPEEPGRMLREVRFQRGVVGTFESRSHPWRREGLAKVLHTLGAVGLFRIEVHTPGAGSVLEPGRSRFFIARYSRARGPDSDEPHVASVAAKFFRRDQPSVDVPFLSWQVGLGEFRRMWLQDFSTDFPDPRTMTTLSPRQEGQVRERVASLATVARALSAPKTVSAYSLPLASPLHGARLLWRHTTYAQNILCQCGNTPFTGRQTSPDDEVPVSELASGEVWAELWWQKTFAADKSDTSSAVKIADIYVESGLLHSPIGDAWLQFTHPGVRP